MADHSNALVDSVTVQLTKGEVTEELTEDEQADRLGG